MTSFKEQNEEYTYGEDLEPQIPEIIRMYKEEGFNTNQAYMAIGSRESIKLADPPCLRGIHTGLVRSITLYSLFQVMGPVGRLSL